jgi:hypothetical protein
MEVGVGALWADQKAGLIGYASYAIGIVTGRLEMNWQQSTGVKGGIAVGLSLEKAGLSLEPHVSWPVADLQLKDPSIGVRLGVRF